MLPAPLKTCMTCAGLPASQRLHEARAIRASDSIMPAGRSWPKTPPPSWRRTSQGSTAQRSVALVQPPHHRRTTSQMMGAAPAAVVMLKVAPCPKRPGRPRRHRSSQQGSQCCSPPWRKVRKTPSWPRSWANFSHSQLHSHRNAWANLHLLGQPNTVLARVHVDEVSPEPFLQRDGPDGRYPGGHGDSELVNWRW
jgi:hypothetical protein